MHKIRFILLTCLFASSVVLGDTAVESSDAVTSPLVSVSSEELQRYIDVNSADATTPVTLDADTVQKVAENLYMLSALAEEAKNVPGFDEEQARWQAEFMFRRSMVDRYRLAYIDAALKDVNWEATAKEAYVTQKELYKTEEMVSASHILIKVKPVRTDEEALSLASDLRKRAIAGEDFGELAAEYSEDPTAGRNKGDMGFFGRGRMVKEFESVAFAMTEKGDISEPVLSPFGYHIIQYHDRKMPEQVPFEEVQQGIVSELKEQMGKKIWRDKLLAMRSDAGIKYNDKVIAEVASSYSAGSAD